MPSLWQRWRASRLAQLPPADHTAGLTGGPGQPADAGAGPVDPAVAGTADPAVFGASLDGNTVRGANGAAAVHAPAATPVRPSSASDSALPGGGASGSRDAGANGETGSGAVERLTALLVDSGHCDARTLERGRRVAAETGQRLDTVLLQLGLISERDLAQAYATLLGLKVTDAGRYPAEPLFADRLAARFLRQARAVPVAEQDGALTLALVDPLDDFTPAVVAAATGRSVRLEVAVPIELDAALNRLYPDGEANALVEEDGAGEASEDDTDRLKDLASEAPVIRLVNQLITRAVETQASDIHIEPFEDRLRVRYRYDGVLQEADSPPPRLAAAITSRIKIMAKLDIAERRLPQDGRIKLAVRGKEVDFRVSTIPSLHGETVVLRILDRTAVVFDYERLGLSPPVVAKFSAALDLPNGIVLVTGPTGSGKTTTLYTGLLALNAVTRKIVTV
jgi:general secretion pathway protein E